MAGGYEVSDLANEALDSIGWPNAVGDIEDGSDESKVLVRKFRTCRQALLRAANWDFGMFQGPLLLLADASQNTANVGTVVPYGWIYEYAYPQDCLRMRYIPWNLENPSALVPTGNIQPADPNAPLTTGLGQLPPGARIIPAKFRVSTDSNYIPPQPPTDQAGVSPQSRTVILTNVRSAQAVYTRDVIYPSVWDPLFREAYACYLGAEIAVPLWTKKDPSQKTGIAHRDRLAGYVRDKLEVARAQNGNEGTSSSDLAVDWMRIRNNGGPWSSGNWGAGGMGSGLWGEGGGFGGGYDSLMISGAATL